MIIDYNELEKKLQLEISKAEHLITEDLIRHWFICSQKLNVKATKIEKPYSKLAKKDTCAVSVSERSRLDLFYEKDDTAIEFKYHRKTVNSANCTTTKAGYLFRDFNRLSTLDYENKYLIYLLDANMYDYYKKRDYNTLIVNGLNKNLLDCKNFDNDLINVIGNEFRKCALTPFGTTTFTTFDYKLKIEYAKQIDTNFYLAGFKII